jgi:hypothetical protein
MDNSAELEQVEAFQGTTVNEEDTALNTAPATAAQVGVLQEEGEGIDDELDDEAVVEGAADSAVQVAPTGDINPIAQEYDDPMLFIQLGDRVVIDSRKYGRTIGTVYYRSLERISVKPDGVSNTLHDFELEQTDEEELYKEEDGVTAAYVIEKRKFESFVEQQDFRINQVIDTFDSSGELYKSYNIVKVDKENDYIQIQDIDDEEDVHDLNFNFTGIESDEDFKIISIRQLVGPSEEGPSEAPSQPLEEEEEEEEEEDEIQVVGFIEITRPKVYQEAAFFEQRIPDSIQKIDALNDFLSSLDPSLQKDPKSLRAVRVLVETLFNLKQATIAYNDDGSVRGQKDISASTLSELIKKVNVPLGRPVLNIKKKEYANEEELDQEKLEEGTADEVYFEDFERELDAMIQNKSSLVSSAMAGAPGGQIVREWNDQQAFLRRYLSPWSANSDAEPIWKALQDSEFFRTTPPELAEVNGTAVFLETVPGYIPSHDKDTPPIFDKIPFGIEKALSTTYRKGADRKKQVLLPEEGATLDSYLLFPIKTANTMGTTRSSSLAIDSGRSQMPKDTMTGILEKTGAPTDVGTSNDLVLLDVNGTTLGNIPLADYIEGISVPALGLGDTFETLDQYGIDNLELTPDIINVLVSKIEMYQSQLLTTIAKLREMIDTEGVKEVEQNPFISAATILEEIRSQPTLVDDLIEYERINPSLAQSDIGKVAYLMKRHPDYFQVAAGKNSVLIAKALLAANNQAYIDSLKIANLLRYNELNSGEKPKPNTCKHVKDLVAVRRIFDDSERFQKFVDFFRKYQGGRDNNWIDCNLCKEHLICIHERLQIQAFLNPKEKDTIQKEIILKCSGGSFQGKYICRNCGQAIRDIDFDNNIEFDDNGKPKSGRAVLVDDDAVFEENLNIIVSAPVEPSQKKQLNLNDDEIKCYDIIREISARIGVTLDNTGLKTVIDKTIAWVNKFPSMDDYNEMKKKRPKYPDYSVAVARNIISAAATFLLLEIQSKIPSYIVRHALSGCKSPGFDGYPLEGDPTKKQGIEYIACAVSSIRRNEAPWNQTGFQKVADEAKRQQGIVVYIDNILKEIISDDIIQAELSEKRKYLESKSGSEIEGGRPRDMIPATFLPEQLIVTPEDAAKDVITPEVVANMGNRGKLALVKLWVRQAHLLAKKTASLVRGSPLSETSCCLTNIEGPGTFWNSATDLPRLNKRTLVPNQQGQFLVTEFIPRPSAADVAEPDKELYYRIFLKCCFQGPRKGYPHEPGLTNSCPWCGFEFPTIPSVMDTDTEGKSALASQHVNTGTEEFTTLLDTIHNVNKVAPIKTFEVSSVSEIMDEFSLINPAPIPGWKDILLETTRNFLSLPPDADRGDIALAAGPISEATSQSEAIINERITSEAYRTILDEIVQLSWVNFFQVIQTYFIVPFQRMLTQFSSASLFVPVELKKDLSETHVVQDVMPILENDTSLLILKGDDLKKPTFSLARSKINYFLKQMSAILSYKNKIRPIVVPGRETTLVYIQRTLLYGPLATLINPSEVPVGTEIKSPVKSVGDPSMKYLLEIVAITLNKFSKERLTFSDQQLKEMIAIRDEKERSNIIAEYSKLTDEERAVELMNQRLGLGKYAVGGTKLIYAYDKDYYDLERQKRLAAGIIDFPGSGSGEMLPPDGRAVDENGFRIYTDGEMERDGGYDHNQHGDDDYE